MSEAQYRLVYFNIRGLAEPIRWMFQIRNVTFVDERIDLEDLEEGEAQFGSENCPFPILYIDDDDEKELTHVQSVMGYVANQLGFNGQNETEAARAAQASELIHELRLIAVDMIGCLTPENPDIIRHTVFREFRNKPCLSEKLIQRKRLQQILPVYFDKFAKMLKESDGEYLAGENITYADLALANFLDICEDHVNPNILDNYPTLKGLQQSIFDLLEISRFEDEDLPLYAAPA